MNRDNGFLLPVIPLRAAPGEPGSDAEEAYFALCERFLLPFLRMLERLEDDGVSYGLTLALPPALLGWFSRVDSAERLAQRLKNRIAQAQTRLQEVRKPAPKTLGNPDGEAAETWLERCRDRFYWFETQYSRHLGRALQRIASFGHLELIATTATHSALPLLRSQPGALAAQLSAAADDFAVAFGVQPRGVWLPDCAYFPGLEEPMRKAGLRFTFTTAAAFAAAQAPLPAGVLQPVLAGDEVAAFALHEEFTHQLVSPKNGYFQDADYLDPATAYSADGAPRLHNRADKHWHPGTARHKADLHATHFLSCLQKALPVTSAASAASSARAAVVCAEGRFWAEQWAEGVEFWNLLLRKACYDQKQVVITTPSRYLDLAGGSLQRACPGEALADGTGLFAAFYEQGADSLLPELQLAASTLKNARGPGRILRQMGRELLLAQEWEGAHPQESLQRAKRHLARFSTLEQMRAGGQENAEMLTALESEFPLFPFLDIQHFR